MSPFASVPVALLLISGVAEGARADDPQIAALPGMLTGLSLASKPLPPGCAEDWEPPQERRDPGYTLYREGYTLILEERWSEARKKFNELLRRYPRSEYRDDARFWNAYSWKFSDRTKALQEYQRFIQDFPSSNYFDDAVSEYQRLGGQSRVTSRGGAREIPEAAFRIAEMEKKLMEIQERLSRQLMRFPQPPLPPREEEPRSQRKLETLRALTRSPEDEKAFAVLKETALDTAQLPDVRLAALDDARRFRVPGVGEFLLDVVRNERDLRFRLVALEGLRATPASEPRFILDALRSLTLNRGEPAELRMSALQVLEREDREEFPGFLLQIVKSDPQSALQIGALQYLSREPRGERSEATKTLQELALDRTRDPAVREIALFGLRQLDAPQVFEVLIETAKTDPQERVRLAAVYSLGTPSHDNTAVINRALEELAADRKQPRLVRQTALAQLARSGSPPDMKFLVSLASGEPDEEIQQWAIHVLGTVAEGKEKSLATLTSLFGSIPATRLRSKDVLLFSIASIGNDRAVDFLASVARSDTSEALRERAVYYLGNIGTEKARGALLEILRNP